MTNVQAWIATAVLLGGTGCASMTPLPKMDPSMPIETENGFRQGGQLIDLRDMVDQLEKDPSSASYVHRAQTLSVVAQILGGVGGALIGWPVGQAAAGDREPLWPLAGAGAGAVVLAIPLAIWAGSSIDSAVEAYNKTRSVARTTPAPKAGLIHGARSERRTPSEQPSAWGFLLGSSKEATATACRQAGHAWTDEGGAGRCTGAPASEFQGASAHLEFAEDRLSAVELVIRPPNDAEGWVKAFRDTEAALVRVYGKSNERSFVIPDECKAAEQFLPCVEVGKVTGTASWSLRDGRSVALSIAGVPAPSTIHVRVASEQPMR